MNRAQIEAHLLLHGWEAVRDERWGGGAALRDQFELHGPWRCYCAGVWEARVGNDFPPSAKEWPRIEMSAIPDTVFAELAPLALGDPP